MSVDLYACHASNANQVACIQIAISAKQMVDKRRRGWPFEPIINVYFKMCNATSVRPGCAFARYRRKWARAGAHFGRFLFLTVKLIGKFKMTAYILTSSVLSVFAVKRSSWSAGHTLRTRRQTNCKHLSVHHFPSYANNGMGKLNLGQN